MPRYDLVIFDFDGTLADSFPWFWEVLPVITAEFRLRPLDLARRDEYRRLSARTLMGLLGVRWWQMPGIARRARQLMTERADAIRLFDGVVDVLAGLHAAGVRLAVVSSNSLANVQRILGPSTSKLIGHYGCGAPVLGKTGRTRGVVRAAGTTPQRTLCIGDELRDADVARAVGADFAAASWGYTLPDALAAAGASVLGSPAHIAARVLGS